MTNKKYNGWTNYETRRVYVEWFDDCNEKLCRDGCKEYVEEHLQICLEDKNDLELLFLSYADAFLDAVNWGEISNNLNSLSHDDVNHI